MLALSSYKKINYRPARLKVKRKVANMTRLLCPKW